jgi:hypothetical protein
MKRFLALVFAASMLASCQTGMIRADAIDGPVNRITDRHDAYVKADDSLSNEEKSIYLRSSELLRRVIAEAGKK